MDTIYELTRKIVVAAGGSPQPGDSRTKLLKRLLTALGGSPDILETPTRLWKKVAAALGFIVLREDSEYSTLYKITNGAVSSDGEWELLNKIFTYGFATPARPYRSYVALLTQVGLNPPTAVVLSNSLLGPISFSRDDVGVYEMTCPLDGFSPADTIMFAPPTLNVNAVRFIGTDEIEIDTENDGDLENYPIEIRKYY